MSHLVKLKARENSTGRDVNTRNPKKLGSKNKYAAIVS